MRLAFLSFASLLVIACSSGDGTESPAPDGAKTDTSAASDSTTTVDEGAGDATPDTSPDGTIPDGAIPDGAVPDEGADTLADVPSDILETGSGSHPACSLCASTAECKAGMVCTDLGIGAAGRFCFYKQSDVKDGDCTNVRPYRKAESMPLVGGGSATVCVPAIALCDAIGKFMSKCTSGKACGTGGDCWAKSGSTFVCTLECKDDFDCPVGSSCGDLGSGTTTAKRCLF